MKQEMKCPICGKVFTDPPAISRKDNKTQICPTCGTNEALEEFAKAMGWSEERLNNAKAEAAGIMESRTDEA